MPVQVLPSPRTRDFGAELNQTVNNLGQFFLQSTAMRQQMKNQQMTRAFQQQQFQAQQQARQQQAQFAQKKFEEDKRQFGIRETRLDKTNQPFTPQQALSARSNISSQERSLREQYQSRAISAQKYQQGMSRLRQAKQNLAQYTGGIVSPTGERQQHPVMDILNNAVGSVLGRGRTGPELPGRKPEIAINQQAESLLDYVTNPKIKEKARKQRWDTAPEKVRLAAGGVFPPIEGEDTIWKRADLLLDFVNDKAINITVRKKRWDKAPQDVKDAAGGFFPEEAPLTDKEKLTLATLRAKLSQLTDPANKHYKTGKMHIELIAALGQVWSADNQAKIRTHLKQAEAAIEKAVQEQERKTAPTAEQLRAKATAATTEEEKKRIYEQGRSLGYWK